MCKNNSAKKFFQISATWRCVDKLPDDPLWHQQCLRNVLQSTSLSCSGCECCGENLFWELGQCKGCASADSRLTVLAAMSAVFILGLVIGVYILLKIGFEVVMRVLSPFTISMLFFKQCFGIVKIGRQWSPYIVKVAATADSILFFQTDGSYFNPKCLTEGLKVTQIKILTIIIALLSILPFAFFLYKILQCIAYQKRKIGSKLFKNNVADISTIKDDGGTMSDDTNTENPVSASSSSIGGNNKKKSIVKVINNSLHNNNNKGNNNVADISTVVVEEEGSMIADKVNSETPLEVISSPKFGTEIPSAVISSPTSSSASGDDGNKKRQVVKILKNIPNNNQIVKEMLTKGIIKETHVGFSIHNKTLGEAINIATYLSLALYPLIMQLVFSFFNCVKTNEKYVLQSDASFTCYDSTWYFYLILILILMLAGLAGIPIFLWNLVNIVRRQLNEDDLYKGGPALEMFYVFTSYLSQRFHPLHFRYEFIFLARRSILTAISDIVVNNYPLQLILITMVIFIAGLSLSLF